MRLKPGAKFSCSNCSTEIVVIRPGAVVVVLTCSGAPFIEGGQPPRDQQAAQETMGTYLGKRYANPELQLEVLCVRSGIGVVEANGKALTIMEPKRLPTSD